MKKEWITSQTLQETLDMNLLSKYINQMYMSLHIPILLCDKEGNILIETNSSPFCKDYMRKDERLGKKCKAICAAGNGKENCIFKCPYGMEIYKTPIKIQNEIVAYIIISQFLTKEPEVEDFLEKVQQCGVETVEIIESVKHIPVVSKKRLKEIITFMDYFVVLIHDMIDKKMRVRDLDEEVMQSYKELEAAYQDISELNARLGALNYNLHTKNNDLTLRETRYRSLLTTMNQGILLLRLTTFQDKKKPYEYSIIDMNPAMQIIFEKSNRAGSIQNNNLMKSDIIQTILSKTHREGNIKDSYFDKKAEKYYDVQSKMLNKCEIMICITDTTSTYEQLKNEKEKTQKMVVAMGSLIEKRDLYTAEHQRNVAVLATRIAIYMGLDKKRIEAIFIASMLHDIGKISIPFEILTKPDKLTEIEYELMKTHVQSTYDILKSINFTLPISEIAYQHHERLDGSGYPRKLKEKDIIFEAKILAVADVYEAITSHRPYRPSLGVDYAINHLTENSGILYDADVVSSCIATAQDNTWDLDAIEEYLKHDGF